MGIRPRLFYKSGCHCFSAAVGIEGVVEGAETYFSMFMDAFEW